MFVCFEFAWTPTNFQTYVLTKLSFLMVLLPGRFLLSNSRSGYLLNSNLTGCFRVKAFCDWDYNDLSFWADELFFNKLQDATNIFGSFISDELDKHFDVFFICLIFEGDFLIEDEFVGGGSWYFCGDGAARVF